ncbi:unnamed protein product [Ectocarpus sp. CCAP 1310/34]|nr:unnamed protein product [Ectocarpus sp. CCAP 1310/34]
MAFLGNRWLRSACSPPFAVSRRRMSAASNKMFSKILIANRGEIACRIIKTAKRMGVATVAVYSDADVNSLHASTGQRNTSMFTFPRKIHACKQDAVEAFARILSVVLLLQALHPGYGFLSENATFAKQCASAGVTFIGPPEKAIDQMGSKSVAKAIMSDAGVPVCPGYHGEDQSDAFLEEEAKRMGFPLMIKAVMGGGGKGMRLVQTPEGFQSALEACRREAAAGFADDRMLLERHQKVLEEAPAPGISDATRAELGEAAVRAAKAVGYVGAGTVEFLMDTRTQEFFFCEMNTRLQVEHSVTEMVTGLDLVEWQLRVAAGQELPLKNQADIPLVGHAIEARICAENVARGFLPVAGTLRRMRLPSRAGSGGGGGGGGGGEVKIRVDTGVQEGDAVSVHYDPMVAKLIVHAPTRSEGLHGLRKALRDFQVVGLPTNIDFCERVAGHRGFEEGGVTTAFLEEHGDEVVPPPETMPPPPHAVVLASVAVLLEEQAAVTFPNDTSPWSARSGPWRAVGVRKQKLVLSSRETAAGANGADDAGLEVTVECLADGGYVVETHGARFAVSGAQLDAGGAMTAIVDGRRAVFVGCDRGRLGRCRRRGGSYALVQPRAAGRRRSRSTQVYELVVTRPRGRGARGSSKSAAESTGRVSSPMPGRVVRVLAESGEDVEKGQELMILEAMKMEHTVPAPFAGKVDLVSYVAGDLVDEGSVLITLKPLTK